VQHHSGNYNRRVMSHFFVFRTWI